MSTKAAKAKAKAEAILEEHTAEVPPKAEEELTLAKVVNRMKKYENEENGLVKDLAIGKFYTCIHPGSDKEGDSWISNWEKLPTVFLKKEKISIRLSPHEAMRFADYLNERIEQMKFYQQLEKDQVLKEYS